MASPPKPWEASGVTASGTLSTMSSTAPAAVDAPALPDRPASLAATVNQNAAAYSRVGGMPGAAPYSPYTSGYTTPYTSPYNRFGSYGGGMYGNGYGGYGGYGAGGMYGNGMGAAAPGQDPNSLTNTFSASTQATFQMLEGVVGAFGGIAQMLESTYMATHSSFHAIIAVAEQFGNLRDTLGSVLGIFAIVRWVKTLLAKVTGRALPADAASLTPAAFASWQSGGASGSGPTRASRKPLMFFALAAFGLPYLMNKLIKSIALKNERKKQSETALIAHPAQPPKESSQTVDASQMEFCRAMYDYTSSTDGQGAVSGVDLEVRKGDIVAVLSKTDPFGNDSEWWRCRSRDGRMGYVPSTYLETIRKPGQPLRAIAPTPPSEISTRTNSLTSASSSVMSRIMNSQSRLSQSTTPETSDASFRTIKGL